MCLLLSMADGSTQEIFCPGRTARNPCPVTQVVIKDWQPGRVTIRNISEFDHVWRS